MKVRWKAVVKLNPGNEIAGWGSVPFNEGLIFQEWHDASYMPMQNGLNFPNSYFSTEFPRTSKSTISRIWSWFERVRSNKDKEP